jgi:hypothetical protein
MPPFPTPTMHAVGDCQVPYFVIRKTRVRLFRYRAFFMQLAALSKLLTLWAKKTPACFFVLGTGPRISHTGVLDFKLR